MVLACKHLPLILRGQALARKKYILKYKHSLGICEFNFDELSMQMWLCQVHGIVQVLICISGNRNLRVTGIEKDLLLYYLEGWCASLPAAKLVRLVRCLQVSLADSCNVWKCTPVTLTLMLEITSPISRSVAPLCCTKCTMGFWSRHASMELYAFLFVLHVRPPPYVLTSSSSYT